MIPAWLGLLLAVFNLAGAVTCMVLAIYYRRCIHRWNALNDLLASIAIRSFMQRHHGTFDAWSAAMGSLEVEVTASRREPTPPG